MSIKLGQIFRSITEDLTATINDSTGNPVVSLDEIEMELDLTSTIEIDLKSFYHIEEGTGTFRLRIIDSEERDAYRYKPEVRRDVFKVRVTYSRVDDKKN